MNNKRFEQMVKFMQGMTTEDVYGSSAISRDVVIDDTVITNNVVATTIDTHTEDDIILPFNCIPMDMVYRK